MPYDGFILHHIWSECQELFSFNQRDGSVIDFGQKTPPASLPGESLDYIRVAATFTVTVPVNSFFPVMVIVLFSASVALTS